MRSPNRAGLRRRRNLVLISIALAYATRCRTQSSSPAERWSWPMHLALLAPNVHRLPDNRRRIEHGRLARDVKCDALLANAHYDPVQPFSLRRRGDFHRSGTGYYLLILVHAS